MAATAGSAAQTPPSLDQIRILIVDDDAQHVQLLRRALERNGYTKIESSSDSRRVVDIIFQWLPDVIVLDVHMPHLDGFGVLNELQRESTARVPPAVIVVSADDSPQTRRAMLSNGASDYVSRPYDSTELALRIRRLAAAVKTQRDVLRHCDELTRQVHDLSTSVNMLSHRLEIADRDGTSDARTVRFHFA
jgi:putative two-component system response regulator